MPTMLTAVSCFQDQRHIQLHCIPYGAVLLDFFELFIQLSQLLAAALGASFLWLAPAQIAYKNNDENGCGHWKDDFHL